MLAVLGSAGTAVHSLGSADAAGVEVHRYSINLGPAGITRAISSEHLSPSMRAEVSLVHYSRLDYDVSVDGTNHLTQIRTTGAYSVSGQRADITSTMDFSNYGTPVSVVPPPAGQVVPAQQFDQAVDQGQGTSTV